MDDPYRFIIIDSDEVNRFVSCKAIMLASRETTIQSFSCPVKGMEYLKNAGDRLGKGRTIIFISSDLPQMKAWDFIEEFQTLDIAVKSKTGVYILGNKLNVNDKDFAARFPFVKGFVKMPLSRQLVTDCVISM
ncbi:MAG: response regulator containing a CheY-like receiver domain and an DNA-binding domain [Bacteroidetes bacterium]|jgi:hypothetical protein|nr:response regulator containing a CheY-like receiver domain and an DNA-binding domain [Bacteroidota bacterium]